jgi:hypothetical protein
MAGSLLPDAGLALKGRMSRGVPTFALWLLSFRKSQSAVWERRSRVPEGEWVQ